MSFGEAALELLKNKLVPEIGEIKQELGEVKLTLGALVTRLESMERETVRRFELVDRRFELIERRMEEQSAEHARRMEEQSAEHARRMDELSRRMDEHSRRMELLDRRMERLEATIAGHSDRLSQLTDAIGRLSLLGDYVRRVDEMAAELRELRRRQDDFERKIVDEVLPRLPKVGT